MPSTTMHNSWRRYLLAAIVSLTATLPLWFLRDTLTSGNFSLVYLLIVLVIAIYQGTGPSLLAALVSVMCFNFFLVKPLYTFLVADPRDLLDLAIYLVSAALTGQLASYARNQRRNAEQRATELNVLYLAATTFNHLTEAAQVYAALQRILAEQLSAQLVELSPSAPSVSDAPADLYTPITIGQRLYGLLHVVFARTPADSKRQLVAACAAQAAVALERIDLVQQAQQSRVFEEADRLKTTLLHSVSHDLRTPLTIIKTSVANLLRLDSTLSTENRVEMLAAIETEADHLNKMVGNLLDFSRLKAGAFQINSELNSLEEVVGDVVARSWHTTHQERIEIEFSPDMPLVPFDYGLLLQALGNLVENALRYEPAYSRIKITGFLRGPAAHVALINHGPNIAADQRDAIMEPFYRSDGGNTGLGLAIAKGIIEAHRGQLWLEDTAGGGATFLFSLPLSESLISEASG